MAPPGDRATATPTSVPATEAAPAPAWQVALRPWLAVHVVVGVALACVAHFRGLNETGDAPGDFGLWVWDGGWYRWIAERGYDGVPPDGPRFFPLLPMLGRGLGWVLGGPGPALLVVTTVAGLGYLVQLVLLVREELGSEVAASRAAWFAAFLPGASVFVLPYTEPVALFLAVAFFRALRHERLATAVLLGALSGLARPTGVLLAAPALLLVGWPLPRGVQDGVAKALAIGSPVLGTCLYLGWTWHTRDSFWAPYSIQSEGRLRGGVAVDPFSHLFRTMPAGLDWRLQCFLVGSALVLLVVCALRLHPAYVVWAALTVAAAVTSSHGRSVPRYLAGTFPLAIALALVCAGRVRFLTALALSAVLFYPIAFLVFTAGYVP